MAWSRYALKSTRCPITAECRTSRCDASSHDFGLRPPSLRPSRRDLGRFSRHPRQILSGSGGRK